MNLVFDLKFRKLNDLCDQVFDYFHLTYYDLESKINNELNSLFLYNLLFSKSIQSIYNHKIK